MKVINIILCVLIFLLAVASAAFSFILFGKRTSLIEGNVKMATSISGISAKLAPDSDRRPVTQADLAHEKYTAANMDMKLRGFEAQVTATIRQREVLAQTMLDIAKVIGVRNLQLDAVRRLETAKDGSRDVEITALVLKKVKLLQSRFDKSCAAFTEIASVLGGDAFSAGNYERSVDELVRLVSDTKGRLDTTSAAKSKLEREKKSLEEERDDYRSRLATANREKATLKRALDRLREEHTALQRSYARLQHDFERLSSLKPGDAKMVVDGSPEARMLVVGRVTHVNRNHGFIAVNLGATSRFRHKVGTKEYMVDPMLRPGLEMVICRGSLTGPEPPTFVARIKIDKVTDDCFIANIPRDAEIRVGDLVIDISRFEKATAPRR